VFQDLVLLCFPGRKLDENRIDLEANEAPDSRKKKLLYSHGLKGFSQIQRKCT